MLIYKQQLFIIFKFGIAVVLVRVLVVGELCSWIADYNWVNFYEKPVLNLTGRMFGITL